MPAYRFRGVHMLLPKLHLSRSTRLMLIAGPERIKAACAHTPPATGDVCLIERI
jgi:S-adenosylmethionine:tRNA-ribosyltransferase-isomerase (queuine synthetase)